MPDFYGRGRATGDFIGSMVSQAGSSGQAASQLADRAAVTNMTELAKNGWGVEIEDGQVTFKPGAEEFYNQIPGAKQLAVQGYQNLITKKQGEAEELRQKKIKTFSDTLGVMNKTVEEAKKAFPKNPEMQVQVEKVVYGQMQKILSGIAPGIWNDPMVRVVGMIEGGLTVKENTEAVIQARITSMLNDRAENPGKWNLQKMDEYRNLYGVASDDMKKIFPSPTDVEKETPPREQAILAREKMRLDEQMKQGIQTAGAVARQKALTPLEVDKAKRVEEGKQEVGLSESELTQRALYGKTPEDRERARKILNEMQERKLAAQKAGTEARSEGINFDLLAQSVADGQDAPMAIKGSMGVPAATRVKSKVLELYPKFRSELADANYKWKQSATNQRTINFVGGSLPRLSALDEQLKALPNVNLNTINKLMAAISKEFGKPEYTNFESNRNAIVQEINTALSGTSQASDLRIKIELENLKSSRSPEQIRGSISNLREALIARMDVDLSPLYPLDVVRGLKTMDEYKKEMFDKYRGKYTPEQSMSSGGLPDVSKGGTENDPLGLFK